MKRTKAQITNFLRDKIFFRINIDPSYIISYDINKQYSFDEIEKLSEKNLEFWENQEGSSNNQFYTQWSQLYNKIIQVKEYLLTVDELVIEDVYNKIYSSISSSFSNGGNGARVYIFTISAPITLDASFSKIRMFIKYYEKVSGNNLSNAVLNFITLSKNNLLIGSFLNNQASTHFFPALYLLQKHLSKNVENIDSFEKNFVVPIKKELEEISKESSIQFSEITKFTEQKHTEINKNFEDQNREFKDFQQLINKWQEEKSQRIKELEKTYEVKLSLESPEKLWTERAIEYKKKANNWTITLVITTLLTIFASSKLVYVLYKFPIGLTKGVPFISQSFIFISVISFLIYVVRIIIKIVMSNHHIAVEYEQKAALTRFYQSLLFSKIDIKDEERLIIINALFNRVESGLVKSDNSNDGDQLLTILSRNSRM